MSDLQSSLDEAAWDVFARHQPYFHILSDPQMWNPKHEDEARFWKAGEEDIARLTRFAQLHSDADQAVDFGCGLGRLTRALKAISKKQIGIDISPQMIEKAQALNASFPKSEFRVIRQGRWPVETASADLVVSLLVLQHLSSEKLIVQSLQEMSRVLKRGGRAVFQLVTLRWTGQCVKFLKEGWSRMILTQSSPQRERLRRRLLEISAGSGQDLSNEEIMNELMQMEFRRIRSLPLLRLKGAMRAGSLHVDQLLREPNGSTTVAATKV